MLFHDLFHPFFYQIFFFCQESAHFKIFFNSQSLEDLPSLVSGLLCWRCQDDGAPVDQRHARQRQGGCHDSRYSERVGLVVHFFTLPAHDSGLFPGTFQPGGETPALAPM